MRREPLLFACVATLSACGAEPLSTALQEPLRVADAQYREGKLPGEPPLTGEDVRAGKTLEKPHTTSLDVSSPFLDELESGFSIGGRATTDTYAVALQLEELGSGYWTLPVGSPDPANNDELSWRTRFDLGPGVAAGKHRLLLTALDADGKAGTQNPFEFCVKKSIPDNLNACLPEREPPALVVSLSWDGKADLDLRILDERGSRIDERHLVGEGKLAGAELQRDSNPNCAAEGAPRENIVWQKKPTAGVYYVYVNLSNTCGEGATLFDVSTHVSKPKGKEFRQVETFHTSGELLSIHADGSGGLGTFVTELEVR